MLQKSQNTKHLFFALATVWAIFAPWLFILSITGVFKLPFGIIQHGQSMLFGFTSALITGYLAGKRTLAEVIWLAGLWMITRIIEVFTDFHFTVQILYLIYGCHLAVIVAPKFISAKKIRNRLISPTLAVIACFPVFVWIDNLYPIDRTKAYIIFVQVLTLLMFFMAGRMITPLLVRANAANGRKTKHRVQPHIESCVFTLVFISIIILIADLVFKQSITRAFLSVSYLLIAAFIFIRLYRWHPTSLSFKDAHLWSLLTGYSWLAVAQVILAVTSFEQTNSIPSLHIVTVGALGIFSSTIITLSVSKKFNVKFKYYYLYATFMSFAVLTRYFASIYPSVRDILLFASVLFWSLAFLLVLKIIIGVRSKRRLT